MVDGARDLEHLAVRLQRGDQREDEGVVARVRQQAPRGVVGRRHQHGPVRRQCEHEPRQQHGVTGVVRVQLVEEQQPHPVEQRVDRAAGRSRRAGLPRELPVQLAGGVVRVQASHARTAELVEQDVDEPRLATPDRSVQVDAGGRPTWPPSTARSETGPEPGQRVGGRSLLRVQR